MRSGRSRHALARKIGMPPGTLCSPPERKDQPVRISLIDYDATQFQEKEIHAIEECFPFRDTSSVTWINIDGLWDGKVISTIGSEFSIHPLILDDIQNTQQRPKFEDLDSFFYINLKMIRTGPRHGDMTIENVSLIAGSNFLITFQEGPEGDVFGPVRERIRKDGRIRKFGTDYLTYTLIDVIVDNYFLVMEEIGERIEALEGEIVLHPTPVVLSHVNRLRKQMIFLRKAVWPLREVLAAMERAESPLVQHQTLIYLRDVYDHTVQVMDTIETYRDMVSAMMDIYLSSLSNRMNEIMKVLTIIATIFMPLTFMTGLYGMNFVYMPILEWQYGFYAIIAVMACIAAGMIGYFRMKRWL